MKIAFGNPTKRINFDFISGSFSKLIIYLPAGPVPSTSMTCLVSEGGTADVKQEVSENHRITEVGRNLWRLFVLFKSQIYTPFLKPFADPCLFPQQKPSICANTYSEQHFCLRKSLSMCLAPIQIYKTVLNCFFPSSAQIMFIDML